MRVFSNKVYTGVHSRLGGNFPSPDKLNEIVQAPAPGNKTKLQSFLKDANCYIKLIPSMADIAIRM